MELINSVSIVEIMDIMVELFSVCIRLVVFSSFVKLFMKVELGNNLFLVIFIEVFVELMSI